MKKFIACVVEEKTKDDRWAKEGEPLIPNFPTAYKNSFLGTESFKPAVKGVVKVFKDLNLDTMLTTLCEQFPSVPKIMLETYVLETAIAANEIPEGHECRPYTEEDSAQILDLNSGLIYTLWTEQPLGGR